MSTYKMYIKYILFESIDLAFNIFCQINRFQPVLECCAMNAYPLLKAIHMTAAYLTVTLFVLRLVLDAAGKPGWRQTSLRWIPHANDTILLTAAISLLFVTGWLPFVHHWLTAKVLLLIGYIVAGVFALKVTLGLQVRLIASVLALVQVMLIFHLAMTKPVLF